MLKEKLLKVGLTWILLMGMLLLIACSHVLVATDRNTHTEFLREGAGCTHYLGSEVSITVPGPGKIAVDGLAWIGLWSHATGNNEEARIYVGSSPTECTFGNEAEGYQYWGCLQRSCKCQYLWKCCDSIMCRANLFDRRVNYIVRPISSASLCASMRFRGDLASPMT